MKIPVNINKLVELMDIQSNELYYYYDLINECFVSVPSEEFTKEFGIDDLTNKYTEHQNFLRIPSKIEIQEFNIMRNFALAVKNKSISNDILKALAGSGAYKKFLNKVSIYSLEKEWSDFRLQAIKKIAINWCKKNELNYEE